MVQQELVAYLKQVKEEGHSLDAVKSVLVQQGWAEKDIEESIVAVSVPIAPSPVAVSKSVLPSSPVPLKVEVRIPKYYISPISVLLAAILFLALGNLTAQLIRDFEDLVDPAPIPTVAPYGPSGVSYDTVPFSSAPMSKSKDNKVTHVLISGIVSTAFWIIAFLVHHVVGRSRRQYLPLSGPFFITAGIYFVKTLLAVAEQLFQKDAQYAVYITLILFIIITTASFMFYQKRSHAEPTL